MHNRLSIIIQSLLIYIVTLCLFFITSFFTDVRLWGLNYWGYYPLWIRLSILGISLIAGVYIYLKLEKFDNKISESNVSTNTPLWFSIGLVIISGVLFYLFRSQTHFLGDGYTVISILAEDNPLIKGREIGESLFHLWFKNLFGLRGSEGAEISYQLLSIIAGILFVVSTIWFANKYYDSFKDRIILIFGMLSGGYILLFFGYVENYSFFVLSVGLFTYISLLVLTRKISRYWLVPALFFTIFLHIFGLILIPGAIYALIAGSRIGYKINSISRPTLYLTGLLFIVGMGCLFFFFYSQISFFRFAILPIWSNRFTLEGYTMFSIPHLLDILNLLFIIVPALGILILLLIQHITKKQKWSRDLIFLTLLSLSGIGAMLLFDPKLGMPRDWDLFSFTGLPLCLTIFILIINRVKNYLIISLLVIFLGAASLSARIVNINTSEIALKQFKSYRHLDKAKSRNAAQVLIQYYNNQGRLDLSKAAKAEWAANFPERLLVDRAKVLIETNKLDSTKILLDQALKVDGTAWDVWAYLGEYYLKVKMYDSSIFYSKTSLGLNPYNNSARNNLGLAYMYLRRFEDAESVLLKAYNQPPLLHGVTYNLAKLYKHLQEKEKYIKYLRITVQNPEVSFIAFKEYGDLCLEQQYFIEAARAYKIAMNKGLDSAIIKNIINHIPTLEAYMK